MFPRAENISDIVNCSPMTEAAQAALIRQALNLRCRRDSGVDGLAGVFGKEVTHGTVVRSWLPWRLISTINRDATHLVTPIRVAN